MDPGWFETDFRSRVLPAPAVGKCLDPAGQSSDNLGTLPALARPGWVDRILPGRFRGSGHDRPRWRISGGRRDTGVRMMPGAGGTWVRPGCHGLKAERPDSGAARDPLVESPFDERVESQEDGTVAFRLRVGGHRGPHPSRWEVVPGRPTVGPPQRPDLGLREFLPGRSHRRDPGRHGSGLNRPSPPFATIADPSHRRPIAAGERPAVSVSNQGGGFLGVRVALDRQDQGRDAPVDRSRTARHPGSSGGGTIRMRSTRRSSQSWRTA